MAQNGDDRVVDAGAQKGRQNETGQRLGIFCPDNLPVGYQHDPPREGQGPRNAIAHHTGLQILAADSLPQAVELAAQQARSGDAVLLSPACASFDMFDDYTHRARVFVDAVAALGQRSGTLLETAA